MERAIHDFVDAVAGQNSDMQWSLDENLIRRCVEPVFQRCYRGDLTAEQALDVSMDYVEARVNNNLKIMAELFDTFEVKAQGKLHGITIPEIIKLQEFFLGLNNLTNWSTNGAVTRQELYPTFVRVSAGVMVPDQGIMIFCDNISVKKDHLLSSIGDLTQALVKRLIEMHEINLADEKAESNGNPTDG